MIQIIFAQACIWNTVLALEKGIVGNLQQHVRVGISRCQDVVVAVVSVLGC